MNAFVIAACIPLLTCPPSLEKQIERKQAEVSAAESVRRAMVTDSKHDFIDHVALVQEMQANGFTRDQIAQVNKVWTESRRLAAQALWEHDKHTTRLRQELRELKCKLPETQHRPRRPVTEERWSQFYVPEPCP